MSSMPANSIPQARLMRVLAVTLLAAAILLPASGCVRRRLTVRSNPPGAQVFVDNQEIGTSPASTSFVYYGTRSITVIKDGYETQTIYERMFPPWYELPVIDFVSETLWPWEVRDERVIDVAMVPTQIVPEQQLLDRADSLRMGATAGQVTPLPGAVPGFAVPTQTQNTPLPGLPGQGLNGLPPAGNTPPPPNSYPQPPGLFQPPPINTGVIGPPR